MRHDLLQDAPLVRVPLEDLRREAIEVGSLLLARRPPTTVPCWILMDRPLHPMEVCSAERAIAAFALERRPLISLRPVRH